MGSIEVEPPLTYPYQPFNDGCYEIRLLKYIGVEQNLPSARLCFEVITYQVPTGPLVEAFYAVSYSWGEKPEVAEIILDGHEVAVPYSSEAALRGLIAAFHRGAGDPTIPIWIDAISINQRDIAEKQKQLPLMKWIYGCACAVCVWIGPAGIHTTAALRALNALKNEREAWFREHGDDATPPNGDLPTPVGCDWDAFSTILAVPWFTRVWTIQEIVLARPGQAHVYCGRYTFSWDDFAVAAKWAFDTHRDVMPHVIKSKYLLPAVMMIKVKMRGRVQLSRLLIATISRGVTKHEDRIYGLLGIRPEEEAERGAIVESYERPLSKTYTAAAAMIMETENSLLLLEQMAVLNRIGYPPSAEERGHWPTWVPRLDIQDRSWGDRGLSSPVTGVDASNANNGLPAPMIRSTPHGSTLHLQGLCIGTVELAFEPLIKNKLLTTKVETDNWDATEVARHFSYLWAPEFITEHSSRETIIAVADSLTLEGYLDQENADDKLIADFGAMMHKSWELHEEQDRLNLVRPAFTRGDTGSIRDFVEQVVGKSSRFRHLKISDGRFGMGPDHVLNGDLVVILLGVNVPMIMRQSGSRYKLMGAVYVSGVMKGEYIRSLSEEEILRKTVTFDIC